MLKKSILVLVVVAALLLNAGPAFAHTYSPTFYVDTAYTGTEYGTQAQPFNTLDEAVAAAQAQPYGGYIWIKQTDGTWWYYGYIATVHPPITGLPLSEPVVFGLLVILSIGLVAGGWFLMRRSRARARLA